ncbi:MAG: hypothetical protein IKP67_04605 [Spirochaetales bacterium]|nr:hypothetical protein [Spirochaetales bacterium]
MKKMLIAAISAIAVIASVVGCQVYDSQTNANLYHSGVKLQDFVADFNKSCSSLMDNSADQDAYQSVMDAYISFNEHFWEKSAMVAVKAYVKTLKESEVTAESQDVTDDAVKTEIQERIADKYNEKLHDIDWCKEQYKNNFISSTELYDAIYSYISPIYALSEFAKYKYDADGKFKDDDALLDFQNERNRKRDDEARAKFIKEYTDYQSFEIIANGDGVKWSIVGLWEKTYKLKWDYNSKK